MRRPARNTGTRAVELVGAPNLSRPGHFWTGIMVNNESGIKDLGDLKGKQVGIPDYCMTAALWMKVTLKDPYGGEAKDVEWHNMRPRGESQALKLELDKDNPPGVKINWLTSEHDPVAMLERGELDAAIGINDPRVRDSSKAHRLLPDNGAELIREFYSKTGCYQPNHHFIIQRRLIDEQPQSAMELYNAFSKSKQIAFERGGKSSPAYLYFPGDDPAKQDAVFGDDPYPMGFRSIGKTLERLVHGSMEQGLIRRPVKLDEVYHPSTLGITPHIGKSRSGDGIAARPGFSLAFWLSGRVHTVLDRRQAFLQDQIPPSSE